MGTKEQFTVIRASVRTLRGKKSRHSRGGSSESLVRRIIRFQLLKTLGSHQESTDRSLHATHVGQQQKDGLRSQDEKKRSCTEGTTKPHTWSRSTTRAVTCGATTSSGR